MKKNIWISSDSSLYYVVDSYEKKYTIFIFMKKVLNTLFIASDSPKRKFNWSNDSIGFHNVSVENNRLFVKYIFESSKIIFTNLNND